MAATALPLRKLSYNGSYTASRKNNGATCSTDGTTFAVPTSNGLEDFSKLVIVLDMLGSTDIARFTAYASTWGTGGGQGNFSVTFNSTAKGGGNAVGSSDAIVYFGPFESARFRTTGGGVDGFKFNIRTTVNGNEVTPVRVEAIGLPGAYSTYG